MCRRRPKAAEYRRRGHGPGPVTRSRSPPSGRGHNSDRDLHRLRASVRSRAHQRAPRTYPRRVATLGVGCRPLRRLIRERPHVAARPLGSAGSRVGEPALSGQRRMIRRLGQLTEQTSPPHQPITVHQPITAPPTHHRPTNPSPPHQPITVIVSTARTCGFRPANGRRGQSGASSRRGPMWNLCVCLRAREP
jgi:hypothetical protein